MIDVTPYIKYVLAAISGGGLATYLTYKINARKNSINEFDIVTNKYKELLEDLQKRVTSLEREVKDLKIVEVKQREKIIELEEIIVEKDKLILNYEQKKN